MARKSPTNHLVSAVFSVTARDLVDHLSAFASLKKLAWSPDVKVAMLKKPATVIEEAVWTALNSTCSASDLQGMLVSLLKPIKEHDLFDLADWMRDLNGGATPEYIQAHWSNARIPKELDDLVKKAIGVQESVADRMQEEGDPDAGWGDGPTGKSLKPRKSVAKKAGKVAKSDMKPKLNGHHGGADTALNGFSIPIKESALDALKDQGMSDKMRWQRVNMYIKALMSDYNYTFRSSPKRETDPSKKGLSLVTYFIEPSNGDGDLPGFIKHLENAFGKSFDSYEEPDPMNPRSFKAWFKHA